MSGNRLRSMSAALKTAATRLRNAERRAYILRVMWIEFQERLTSVFDEFDSQGEDAHSLGGLRLTFLKLPDSVHGKPNIHVDNSLHQARITTGRRRLGVWHRASDGQEFKPQHVSEAVESEAGIRFTQEVNGRITITLHPYRSVSAQAEAKALMLDYGVHPHRLSQRAIRRYLKTFFRYCVATSMVSHDSLSANLFRQWLLLHNCRSRIVKRLGITRYTGRAFLIGLFLAAIWMYRFTGN